MKNLLIALTLVLALPATGAALDTEEILGLVAMPLAVAAVADLADVPAEDVVGVVSALNRAAVPAPRVVEVVRYSPVMLVDRTVEPPFVSWLDERVDTGLRGEPLAVEIVDRYQVYGIEDYAVTSPRVLLVEDEILPPVVRTRFDVDPLALVAMPLAVAAVAELADVPVSDLMSLVMALNRADVPPLQFVEVVRYSPVVLLDDRTRPQFMQLVTTTRDVNRDAYALALAQHLRTRGAEEIDVVSVRRPVLVSEVDILPPVVRNHPHGGPPGQLKKELGLQTGAEVVHGTRRGRSDDRPVSRVVQRSTSDDDRGRARVETRKPGRDDSPGRARGNDDRGRPPAVQRGGNAPGKDRATGNQGRGNSGDKPGKGNSGNPGKGNSGNSGKGKGKG